MTDGSVTRADLEEGISSGRARQTFDRWAVAQGADAAWLAAPQLELAPHEVVIEASAAGVLAGVDTRKLGLLLAEAGGGRSNASSEIDPGIALAYRSRLGAAVQPGDELVRVYLRRPDDGLVTEFGGCFRVAAEVEAPPLVYERVTPRETGSQS